MRNPFRRSQSADIEERSIAGATPLGGQGIITDPAAIPPFPGYGRTIAGIPVNAESAMQVPAVFAAIRCICFVLGKMGDPYAATVSLSDDNIPYEVRQSTQPPFLTDTFAGSLGNGTFGLMNYDGRNRTIGSMALFGEAWWYTIETDRLARPRAVEPLNPLWLDIKTEGGVRHYLYGLGSDLVELDPSRLTHIPLMSQPGGIRGLSSIRYLGVMMGLALASLEFGSLFFAQGASPSFLLSTDQKISEENAARLVEKFLVQHAGLAQSHLPLLLDQNLKAQKVQATPDEAQYNQTLTAAYESIAGWFGVPPYLLGVMTERGNAYGVGATEELMRRFESTCLSGYITALEETYTRMLPGGTVARFDTTKLVKPDAQAMAALLTAVNQSNTMTPNEIRSRYLGLGPHPDGDDLINPLASNTAPEQTNKPSEPEPVKGEKGDRGDTGPEGKQGPAGRDGRDGPPGKDGPVGPRGATGQPGREGRNGNDGLDGRDGDKGDPGDQGPKGDPGSDGAPGERGATGKTGRCGRKGDPGKDADPREVAIRLKSTLEPELRAVAEQVAKSEAVIQARRQVTAEFDRRKLADEKTEG